MKKYIAIVTLLVVCQAGFGQKKVDDLFKEFKKMDNVVHISMGKFTMKCASLFTETMGIDGIEVFAFEDCSPHEKDKLTKVVNQLKDSKYETMVNANENGERTKVLIRIEDDMIRELVVVTTGNEAALVRIKGKIKPEDIQRVVDKHGKGGC